MRYNKKKNRINRLIEERYNNMNDKVKWILKEEKDFTYGGVEAAALAPPPLPLVSAGSTREYL